MMSTSEDVLFEVEGYSARRLESGDTADLKALCRRCVGYFELVLGGPPGPNVAEQLFAARPAEKSLDDKLLIGVFATAGRLVGILDVIRDYPRPAVWHLGLMMLEPTRRGRGLGEKLYRAFERWAAAAGARHIRIGVVERNERSYRFWQRMGFQTIERRPAVRMGLRENVVLVMLRALEDTSGG